MDKEQLKKILEKHKKWLNNEEDGERADLRSADLSFANLRYADLRYANLSSANLRYANLSSANLSFANLCSANLSSANLRYANLSSANLSFANLCSADLSFADLSSANLSFADLSSADLSSAKNLTSNIDFLESHFERCQDGYVAYKTFNLTYASPGNWSIKPCSVITENVNFSRNQECGCGINVAPLKWIKKNYPGKDVWKCLIRWEWLAGVCCPYNSDGKIRCEKVELLEVVK